MASARQPQTKLATDITQRAPCWGIGLARTGTTSFCAALELLGYERVGHNPALSDIPRLDAGADNGVLVYYKYIDHLFPGSKFVRTHRTLTDWLSSMEFIMHRHPGNSPEGAMRRMLIYETVGYDRHKLIEAHRRNADDIHRYFRDRPNDLLELNIVGGEGWEKLCPFLNLPQPSVSFPAINARDTLNASR